MRIGEKYINLVKNIGVFALSNFSVRVVTFLVLPLYTYYLSTSEYAIVDLVNTTAQLVLPFLSLCIVEAVLRFGISAEFDLKTIFTNGFLVITVGCMTLPIFLFVFKQFVEFDGLEVYFIVIYLLQVFNSLFSAFYKAISRVKEMAVISMISSIAIVLFNVLFIAVMKRGVEGYFSAVIFGNLLGTILYVFVARLYRYFRLKSFNKDIMKEMLTYSIPLIPNALFWWINSSMDKYSLTVLTSLSVVGIYSVAMKIPTIVTTVNSIFTQAWNLSAFQSYNDEDSKEFYNNMYVIFRNLMLICTCGIILFSRVFALFLFSKDFYAAWVYVPVLTAGVYYNSISGFLGSLFTAAKKTKYIFYTTGLGALVNIILNIVLIHLLGGQGAAIATLTSYVVVMIFRAVKVRKLVNMNINYKEEILFFIALMAECYLMICNNWVATIAASVITAAIVIYVGKPVFVQVKSKLSNRHK